MSLKYLNTNLDNKGMVDAPENKASILWSFLLLECY